MSVDLGHVYKWGFGGKGKGGAKLSFFNSESYILFIQINKGLEYHFISLF